MKQLSGLMVLVAFLSFGAMSTLAFAGGDKKDEKKGEGGQVVIFGDEKKDGEKGKGGQVVIFGDEKKDEKKGMGGK